MNFDNIQIGKYCPKCSIEQGRLKRSSNKEEFINKAKLIHGDYYDYSNVVYINAIKKVQIVCPQHGSFLQSPSKHLWAVNANYVLIKK